MVVEPEILSALLQEQNLQPDWTATIKALDNSRQ
jgi:hypothetical protein